MLVHNFYGSASPSGENVVLENERKLLKENGFEVVEYFQRSDDYSIKNRISLLFYVMQIPWNVVAYFKFRKLLKKSSPDVIHVHNTFPFISPSILYACDDVPVVMTLHNYRLLCPAGIPMRGGKICVKCIENRNVYSAIKYRCYRSSFIASVVLGGLVSLHRAIKTWDKRVSKFIVLNEFQKNVFVDAGFSAEKIAVKPNFCPSDSYRQFDEVGSRAESVAYVGRLSEEKGVLILIKAWEKMGEKAPQLDVYGDGPQREALKCYVDSNNVQNISFHGVVPNYMVIERLKTVKLVVVPSLWFEGFPMVLAESLSVATPLAVSNIGCLPEVVNMGKCGVVFEPGNVDSLVAGINTFFGKSKFDLLSKNSRKAYVKYYSQEACFDSLRRIYGEVVT